MTDLVQIKELDTVQEKIKADHKLNSEEQTPKHFVKRRPDGFDYVEEAYLRSKLNEKFPIWSWEAVGGGVKMIGAEWCIVTAQLVIIDNGIPRKFFSPGAARIQFKRGAPHVPENVVDIDKNLAAANSNGFKRACNRIGNIADDVYRKQIEDITLSPEQIEIIEELMAPLDDEYKENVREAIQDGTVTTKNLDGAIKRITEHGNK